MRFVGSMLVWVCLTACGTEEPTRVPYIPQAVPCALADEGQYRCAGAAVQQCESSKWLTRESCLPGTCNPATFSCEGTNCTAEHLRCNASTNTVETCNTSGSWETLVPCGASTCVESGTSASCQSVSCTTGDQQCLNNTIQTCSNDVWSDTTPCGAQSCVETSSTTAQCQSSCTAGNQQCLNNNVQTCNGTTWVETTQCGNLTCVQAGITASCQGGSTTCTQPSGGEYYVCRGTEIVGCNGTTEAGSFDCGSFQIDSNTYSGWCWDFGSTVDCVMPLGTPCSLTDGENDFILVCGTANGPSANMGCNVIDGCVYASPCNPSTFDYACESSTDIALWCNEGLATQPIIGDCSIPEWGGGYCDAGSCWNTDAGDPCTAGSEYYPIQCDSNSGLTCSTTAGAGTCE